MKCLTIYLTEVYAQKCYFFLFSKTTQIGEENGNPLQHSCLENPTDRGALWATVLGVTRVGHDLATKSPPPPQIRKQSTKD